MPVTSSNRRSSGAAAQDRRLARSRDGRFSSELTARAERANRVERGRATRVRIPSAGASLVRPDPRATAPMLPVLALATAIEMSSATAPCCVGARERGAGVRRRTSRLVLCVLHSGANHSSCTMSIRTRTSSRIEATEREASAAMELRRQGEAPGQLPRRSRAVIHRVAVAIATLTERERT